MTTKFYVDESGNYLGGYDGYVPTEPIFEDQVETVQEVVMVGGREMHGPDGRPLLRQREIQHRVIVGRRELPKVYPQIPAGAVEIPAPPRHGQDKFDHAAGRWISHDDGQRYVVSK